MSTLDGFHIDKFDFWRDFKSDLYRKIEALQIQATGGAGVVAVNPKRFIFRGQACSSWKLESAFDRRFKQLHARGQTDVDGMYQELLLKFVDDCQYFGVDANAPESLKRERYLEELGQHHGFPTRLIDWSVSPYVAAFFAFSEERHTKSGSVSIWALDCDEMTRCWRPQEVEVIRNPFSNNHRMRMQHGLFTKNGTNLIQLEQIFLKSNNRYHNIPRYPVLFRFDVPVTEATEAMADLERMGIDNIKLFPGIEGLCKYYEYVIWRQSR